MFTDCGAKKVSEAHYFRISTGAGRNGHAGVISSD